MTQVRSVAGLTGDITARALKTALNLPGDTFTMTTDCIVTCLIAHDDLHARLDAIEERLDRLSN